MSRLPHISAVPRRGDSESLALAEVFLDAYTAEQPAVEVERLDLIGITDITEIRFQPTVLTANPDQGRTAAHAQARDAGKVF